MIALDTNVVLHFLVSSQTQHQSVRRWFEKNTSALVVTPTNVGEILRLLTHPQVFSKPLTLTKAISLWDDFIESFNILILEEEAYWWKKLPKLIKDHRGLTGNRIFDARIALCLQHHHVEKIFTFDEDFKKFSFLKVMKL